MDEKPMKPEAFFVISNWKNNCSWIEEYTNRYIIYDKSNTLPDGDKIIRIDNVGHNIYDCFHFITNNYDSLPEITFFGQGLVWDHCKRETFDKLIYNTEFTPIEDYAHVAESYAHRKAPDGNYTEINSSWYLLLPPPYEHRKYHAYDQFMNEMFTDYTHVDWIRFSPGAQYVVPKRNILKYSKEFYMKLMSLVDYAQYTMEAHLLERALFYIFSNRYEERL